MKTLTAKRALGLLADVVSDYGVGHVYDKVRVGEDGSPACVYIKEGQPSCLIGHVLDRFGIPKDFLTGMSSNGFGSKNDQAADYIALEINKAAELAFEIPNDVASLLRVAQEAQDNGESWGNALVTAVQFYTRSMES